MRFLRFTFVMTVCATPLLWSGCSKTPRDEPTASMLQDVDVGVPEETIVDQEVAADQEGTSSQPGDQVPASDQGGSDSSAGGGEVADQANGPPVSQVQERKSSRAARAKGEINFDDLKFDLEKDQPFEEALLTNEIRQLQGVKVKLRGYILPSTLFSETNISQFVLVRDNQECCFGPGAALFDCVMIEMVPGKTTDFVTRPVTVEGKFVIDTESYRYPPGYSPGKATHMAVFRIEGESVQ